MPRLSKRAKLEWDFFIKPSTGRRTYNDLCRRCTRNCKQSFRAEVVDCPGYESKRTKGAMLINVQLRSKQEEIQPVRCDVACIVELSNAEFYDFQFNPLADHAFIKEHLPDLKTDEFHAIPCMLVLGEGVDDGILVDPQGYDYARYTAYIPMARQLFQNEQIESENEAPEEDDLEEEPFQGMTM